MPFSVALQPDVHVNESDSGITMYNVTVGENFEVLCVSDGDNVGNVTWRDANGRGKCYFQAVTSS